METITGGCTTGGCTTGGWICPYCLVTVPWETEHICPALKSDYHQELELNPNVKLEQAIEGHFMKCPKCGEEIRIHIGHYIALPDMAKKL